MKISIGQPLSFSEIGKKDNQEDYLYPYPESVRVDQRFFILCDGMGGHEHGEVASQTVAEAMGKCFEKIDLSKVSTEDFNVALAYAYSCLDEKDTDEGGKKMGTTMTCVIFHEGGALVAHIGDSRVYHINPKTGIRYVTSDHSLVNDLLKADVLTEEEAKDFPQKNIITRAMQPHQERRAKADICQITDIEPGDYFFMCCDGVLEQLTNDRLCEILGNTEMSDVRKLASIKAECDNKTKDNYTCWLVPISNVEKEETDIPDDEEDVIQAVFEEPNDTQAEGELSVSEESEEEEKMETPTRTNLLSRLNKSIIFGIVLLIILLIGCCVVWTCHYGESDANDSLKIEENDSLRFEEKFNINQTD